jgi:hypothetical protein
MPTQPCSPISRKGSKAGSNQPLGPGTNTNPSGPGPHQPSPQPVERIALAPSRTKEE